MSAKVITKEIKQKRNENSQQKMMHCDSSVQKPTVFHNNSKPSPVLSDRSEFPSLSESSGKILNNSSSAGKILKYSDKLKLPSSENQNSVRFNSKSNAVVSNAHAQDRDRYYGTKTANKWCQKEDKNDLKSVTQSCDEHASSKSRFLNSKVVDANSSQNKFKKQPNQRIKESTSLFNQSVHDNKIGHSKDFKSDKTLKSSPSTNLNSRSNSQIQCSKLQVKENESKVDADGAQSNSSAKKKKKRKSKVKRQVALQSGKITVLTPEVHFKILNQTSALNVQNSKSVLTDINDEEEYPELGKSLTLTIQKENYPKKDVSVEPLKKVGDKLPIEVPEENVIFSEEPLVSGIVEEKQAIEKKGKNDSKIAVHLNDPIKISVYDMLLSKNSKPKVRDFKKEGDILSTDGLIKIKGKKNTSQPHNSLDSSSPMIKRGKEREKPKPKKPSHLKKIILSDRKARKEQLLHLKCNNSDENFANGDELVEGLSGDESDSDVHVIETNNSVNNSDVSVCQLDEIVDKTLLLSSDNDSSLQDELVPKIEQIDLLKTVEQLNAGESSIVMFNNNMKSKNYVDDSNFNLSLDKMSKNDSHVNSQIITKSCYSIDMPSNVSHSDTLSSSLINNLKKLEISDKERAAKILLHTRNFREYCNHLISKDIDDAVYALLDDLARFQDRSHQKDPVKARMKKRMIYGVKEVKKHIKLKKLKCIIIAVDIENVEAQGGLNDVLNDIKVSATDHHIPCIFALNRKMLGKVCHKPVPVSCVGIFNFEGSEANFKKMVELQAQSKADYNEIYNKLALKLTDEEAATLLRAKKEAPETLHTIRIDILNDFFLHSKTDAIQNDCIDS